MRRSLVLLFAIAAVTPACGGSGSHAAPPDAVDKSATCASTFGSTLTPGFGRLDGTVLAIVPDTSPHYILLRFDEQAF